MSAAAPLRVNAGDVAPYLLLPLLAAATLPAMSFGTWLTLVNKPTLPRTYSCAT